MPCPCGEQNARLLGPCPQCGRWRVLGLVIPQGAIDALAGGGLLLALLLAILFAPRSVSDSLASASRTQTKANAAGDKLPEPTLDDPDALNAKPLRLGVTPVEYDDMGKLLDTLGEGYRYQHVLMDDLLDYDRIKDIDVLFFTCGGVPRAWLGYRVGSGERNSQGVFQGRKEILDRMRGALRTFVARGGTLYASDWQYQLVAIAFPEFVDTVRAAKGAAQTVKARVVDPGLKRELGAEQIELRFDKDAWRPAAFIGGEIHAYLRATYQTQDHQKQETPLLVEFPYQNGNVIFTSFHNEAQNSQLELKLLRYLVFATVTARADARVQRKLVSGGFSPVERDLLSASTPAQELSQKHVVRVPGHLQFVLGFDNRGAELQLTVTDPQGNRRQKSGASSFILDVPDAAAGVWSYTVTPIKVPYKNFPFTLTVGEKQ